MNFRKVIITSLVGSIGIAVLSLSLSIAWFNTSENLYLDTLVISVSGEQQLRISTSGEDGTFVESLKYKIDEDDNDLNNAGLFQPVSSMFKSKWLEDDLKTEPEMYIYTNSAVDAHYAPTPEEAQWGYYKQHLFLYSSSTVNATLDAESLIVEEINSRNSTYAYELITQEHVKDEYKETHPDWEWDPNDPKSIKEIHDYILSELNKMKYCMRIAILDVELNKFYIIDPYKDGPTLLGGRADLFLNKYYDDYLNEEDHQRYEVIYGEVTGRENAFYHPARDTDSAAPEVYTSFASRTKAGTRAFDLALSEGLEIKEEDSLSLEEVEEKMILPLKSGQPKEIVLMAYMEGWDLDCTNKHMGGNFNIDLQFKISEEKQ